MYEGCPESSCNGYTNIVAYNIIRHPVPVFNLTSLLFNRTYNHSPQLPITLGIKFGSYKFVMICLREPKPKKYRILATTFWD